MVVVEVRQRTLWDLGSQLDEEDEEDDEEEEDEERRKRRGEGGGGGGEEEQATYIKSNNPHLAGGEKEETETREDLVSQCLVFKCKQLFL